MFRLFNQYVSPKLVLLALTESALIALSVWSAIRLAFWNDPARFASNTVMPGFAIQSALVVTIFLACFYYNDLYNFAVVARRMEQLIRMGESICASVFLLGLIYLALPSLLLGREVLLFSIVLGAASVVTARIALDAFWHAGGFRQRVLILGTGELASAMIEEFRRRSDLPIEIVGCLGMNSVASSNGHLGRPILGSTDDLRAVVDQYRVSRVVVAAEDFRGALPLRDLVTVRTLGLQVEEASTALASLTGRVWLSTVRPSWFVFGDGFRRSRLTRISKRALDIACGMSGLVLCAPVMGLIALAIKLDSRGPALYRQRRVGFRGASFDMLKFRSMQQGAEQNGGAQWARQNDPRVTRIGKYLRKYRLDELPQFVNVLRGDMSLVGPRPERPEFVEKLRDEISFYDDRHSVRPGITGWAQVRYTYGASFQDSIRKLEYDLFYLKHMSILFDFLILLKTIPIVFGGRGSR